MTAESHDRHHRPHPLARRPRPPDRGRRAGRRRAFSRQTRRCSCWARKRCCSRPRTASSASPSMPAASSPARPTARASSPAATTASLVATDASRRASRSSPPTTSDAGSIRSRSGPDGARRLVGRQDRACAHQEGRAAQLRGAVDGGGPGLRAQRLPARHRALQRRHALVSQRRRRQAGNAGMEGLASRRRLQPGRQIPGHRHAGADAARLAPRRRQAHAHVGLFGARALARLDRGRRLPRHLGLRAAHPVAVRRQGRPDGPAAEDPGAARRRAWRSWPAIRASRWWRWAMPTARCCWCASTTAR